MTSTLQTTITRILNQTLAQCTDLDPTMELDLTDPERADMDAAASKAFEAKADAILAPYGCTMLGDGEIIRTDIHDESVLEWDEETIREELATIDISEVLDSFIAVD